MKIQKKATEFAVIGLGRFGQSVTKSLSEYGANILACDKDEDSLHAVADYATQLVQADAAEEETIEQLGINNFDVVVIAMGENFSASLMAVMTAKELGAPFIVAKAYGHREKKIFESIGADLVVQPEQEMGAKVAHKLVRPNVLDILEDAQHYQISEMHPLPEWVNKTVQQADIRNKHKTSLLAIIRGDEKIIPVPPEEVLLADDVLICLCDPE